MQSPTKHFDERELIIAQRICSVSVVHRPRLFVTGVVPEVLRFGSVN
jgi:hypothetical protein